ARRGCGVAPAGVDDGAAGPVGCGNPRLGGVGGLAAMALRAPAAVRPPGPALLGTTSPAHAGAPALGKRPGGGAGAWAGFAHAVGRGGVAAAAAAGRSAEPPEQGAAGNAPGARTGPSTAA